ncbi:MAG: hypothetical protein ABW123_10200 [Cystobacter sp.]
MKRRVTVGRGHVRHENVMDAINALRFAQDRRGFTHEPGPLDFEYESRLIETFDHRRPRNLVQKAFTPNRAEELRIPRG